MFGKGGSFFGAVRLVLHSKTKPTDAGLISGPLVKRSANATQRSPKKGS